MIVSFSSKIKTFFLLFILLTLQGYGQLRNEYEISFENAVHHEATINAVFRDLKSDTISFRMSRTSPGRYGLHEFAKNISNVKVTDGDGKELSVTKPNPHQWNVTGHNGTLFLTYTLFGDRGDGTYAQVNQNHALLNPPATFMYVPSLKDRPIQLNIITKNNPKWKIDTQLISQGGNSFLASNLDYFMDSPILISEHKTFSYTIQTGETTQTIKLAIAQEGNEEDINFLFNELQKAIKETQDIFGAYPLFDFGTYTFLICAHPSVVKDEMGHQNSAVITNPNAIQKDNTKLYLNALIHQFLSIWNPKPLQKLSFPNSHDETANISDVLWFTEGFTTYYTNLVLRRAGTLSTQQYLDILSNEYNYVWNAPALKDNTCIEMSRQAPLVDTDTFIDPIGAHNSFVSYNSYGHLIALALDLSLRNKKLNLDGYMNTLWDAYGTSKTTYTIANLQSALATYAGKEFSKTFFENYIFNNLQPNFSKLLSSVHVMMKSKRTECYFGANIKFNADQNAEIISYIQKETPAYKAGFEKNDILLTIDNLPFNSQKEFNDIVASYSVKNAASISFVRNGKKRFSVLRFVLNPNIKLLPNPKRTVKLMAKRQAWLN